MKYLYLALSVTLVFAACNRTPTPTLTRLDMLRTGKWKMTSGTMVVKIPNGKDTTMNYLDWVPSCHLDDYIVFNTSTTGAVFNGANTCSPGDPDSTAFQWSLSNNYNTLSLYRGFSIIWSIQETIDPLMFDTLSQSPLELDTIHGFLDSLPGFVRVIPILDSIWTVHYYSDSVPNLSIYNAQITNFSQNSFTLYFTVVSTFPDTVGHHEGQIVIPSSPVFTVDFDPIIAPDTIKYTLTYTNE